MESFKAAYFAMIWPFSRRTINAATVELDLKALAQKGQLVPYPIQFVLFQLRDDELAKLPFIAEAAARIAKAHKAMTIDVGSSIVLAAFGLPSDRPSSDSSDKMRFVEALTGELQGDIRVVHGTADGVFGLLGIRFTVLFPNFAEFLSALLMTEFGSIKEFRSNAT